MPEDEFAAQPAGDEEDENHDRRENKPERHHRGAGITAGPLQEVPESKQQRRRVPQKMDPADGKRADATDGDELDQAGYRGEEAHNDAGSQEPHRAARPERVTGSPEGKVRPERTHHEADR